MAWVTHCWCLDVFVFFFCAFIVLYIYILRAHAYWKARGVKSISTTNIFGNFSDCIFARKSLRALLNELYFTHTDEKIVGFYVFHKPFLLLRDPEAIKSVLVRDFKNFSNRCIAPDKKDFIGSVNIFSLRNPAWKVLRQNVSPVFTSSKLKNMFELMLQIGDDLDIHLKSITTNGQWKVVEVKELCEKFTTDVIGLTMFGMNLNSLKDQNAEFRMQGSKHFQNTYKRYFSLLSVFFMPQLVKLLGITFFDPDVPVFFKRVIPEAMIDRMRRNKKSNDLIDAFVGLKELYKDEQNDVHQYFQDDGLAATAIVFFLGGFEPSASLMYFVLYELAKQPDIQEKLRREILDGLQETDGKITYDVVMALPYLDMVCSEGLRKYPLLHFLDRESEKDYTFSDTNVTIEKGTPIIIPMSALHMDPKYFPNPEVFDPERFSSENRHNILPFTYFPFGEGPRNCIGMRIGLMQAKLGLIYILSKYEVSPCQETPVPLEFDNYSLFTKSRYNMKLNMRSLNNPSGN